jgi:hypothetical protein
MPGKSNEQQTFYRWVDTDGRVHVVSSLEAVPANRRDKVELVSLNAESALPRYTPPGAPLGFQLEWLSFGLGFAAALAFALVFRFLPNGWKTLTRFAIVLGLGALVSGLYLAAIRRQTGATDGGVLASPSALIEDARGAVDKMTARQKQQEEELKKIQQEGR